MIISKKTNKSVLIKNLVFLDYMKEENLSLDLKQILISLTSIIIKFNVLLNKPNPRNV